MILSHMPQILQVMDDLLIIEQMLNHQKDANEAYLT